MKLFFSKKHKSNQGFTLLEVLVAVAIFSVSILAMMSVLAEGIASTNYAKQKLIASYLAQEGVEYIRNQRDSYILSNPDDTQMAWDDFKDAVVGYTYPTDPDFASFDRIVHATLINTNEVRVSSTVEWTHGSVDKSVTFSENLFNWAE